jgi:hypothetical protein
VTREQCQGDEQSCTRFTVARGTVLTAGFAEVKKTQSLITMLVERDYRGIG